MSETKVDGIYLVIQREDNLWEAGYQHVEIAPGWSRATPRPRLFTATDLLHLVSPRDDFPHVIHVSVHSSHLLRRRRRFPDLHDTCYRPTDPLLGEITEKDSTMTSFDNVLFSDTASRSALSYPEQREYPDAVSLCLIVDGQRKMIDQKESTPDCFSYPK